ncbi:MAG: phenylalanine--tRNA ligase subunit beta [Alphaproteobacteria bacterium]
MKFTLSWLKDHLETDIALDEIVQRLTALGLEVEGTLDRARALAPFTVAYVIEATRHPNADRLSVCRVDTGKGEVQVVCGAPNARTGMKGVFAPSGSHIPGTGVDLKSSVIRGVESQGMLCSEHEMGLSQEHDGIIELAPDAPIGQAFAALMGLDDPVIELSITPNRGDCLGVRGIARDLAAAGLGRLKAIDASPVPGAFASPIAWRRDFADGSGQACPFVVGRYFRGVKNGPSPEWLRNRLKAIGVRPISALVDITNYVTFDLGRPLHVFDADKLAGDVTMRFAKSGESILALDGRRYELDGDIAVIADSRQAHAIGGIMGGEDSGVSESTVNVFLEAALFDPIRVAATGRRLGIESDARYRFERGVDPASPVWGAEIAARLIRDLCGGEASALTQAGEMPSPSRALTLRPSRVATLGGADVPASEQRRILEALGFAVREISSPQSGDVFETLPPTWRREFDGEADLVEEVLRIWGYDKIPPVPVRLEGALPGVAITPLAQRGRLARRALAQRFMIETVTWSFMAAKDAVHFGGAPAALRLANPISTDLDQMRPSILPNLIAAASRNAARGFADIAMFEVGPQYSDDTQRGQSLVAAGVIAGATPRHWAEPTRAADAFDAKAAVLAVLGAVRAPLDKLQLAREAPGWYHPGRSATYRLGPNVLARFGELHPRALAAMDARGPMAGFEIFLDAVPQPRAKSGKARTLLKPSPFQPVYREFAFVLAADMPAEKLVAAVRGADKALIAEVRVFDVYAGSHVGEGEKSLALSVALQPVERTLTDAEIEAVGKKIVEAAAKQAGAALRG